MCAIRIRIALWAAGRGDGSTREEGGGWWSDVWPGLHQNGLSATARHIWEFRKISGHLAKVFYPKAAMRKEFLVVIQKLRLIFGEMIMQLASKITWFSLPASSIARAPSREAADPS